MDLRKFIQNRGLIQVPNPEYNPKSKKNTVPPTITVVQEHPDKDNVSAMSDAYQQSAFSVDKKTLDKLDKYHVSYRPGMDINKELSDAQSGMAKLGNSVLQTAVSEIGLGTLIGVSDLFDFVAGSVMEAVTGEANDYQNPVTNKLIEWQDAYKEYRAIYSDPDKHLGTGGMKSMGWWASNFPSVASALTLLIPAAGTTRVLGSLATKNSWLRNTVRYATGTTKKLKAAQTARAMGQTAEEIDKIAKLNKFQVWANSSKTVSTANLFFKNGTTAALSRAMENYQESRQTYNAMYAEASEHLGRMSDEEYNQWLQTHSVPEGVDPNNRDAVAKSIASQAADKTFAMDWWNVVFDVIELYCLRNIWKGISNAPVNSSKIVKAQREAKLFAGANTDEALRAAKEARGKLGAIKDYIGDHGKAFLIIGACQVSEGVEEAVNYVAQQEGMHLGGLLLGTKKDDTTFDSRLADYALCPELWDSAFWGFMGGVVFQVAGSGLRRLSYNIKHKKDKAKEQGIRDLNLFSDYDDLPEVKRRTTEINGRRIALSQYQADKQRIENGEDIYNKDEKGEATKFDKNDKAKMELLLERRKNEFINNLVLNAMNSGNIELLREYLTDENVKKAFIENGVIDKNTANADMNKILGTIDKIQNLYSTEFIELDHIASQLNAKKNKKGKDTTIEDTIPIEYLQIIATENVKNQLLIDRYQALVNSSSDRVNELFDRHEGSLSHSRDYYETASKLDVMTVQLGMLYSMKKNLLKKKSLSALDELELSRINKNITIIEDELDDLQLAYANHQALGFVTNPDGSFRIDTLNKAAYAYRDAILAGRKLNIDADGELQILSERSANIIFDFEEDRKAYGVQEQEQQEYRRELKSLHNEQSELAEALRAKDINSVNVLWLQNKFTRGTTAVQKKIAAMHNTMNEARAAVVDKSCEVLGTLYDKYGEKVKDAFKDKFYGYNYSADEIIDTFETEDERQSFKDAIDALILSDPANEGLYDRIMTQFATQDFRNANKQRNAAARAAAAPTPAQATNASQSPSNQFNPQNNTNNNNQPQNAAQPTQMGNNGQSESKTEQIEKELTLFDTKEPIGYITTFTTESGGSTNPAINMDKITDTPEVEGAIPVYRFEENGEVVVVPDFRNSPKYITNDEYFTSEQSIDFSDPNKGTRIIYHPRFKLTSNNEWVMDEMGELEQCAPNDPNVTGNKYNYILSTGGVSETNTAQITTTPQAAPETPEVINQAVDEEKQQELTNAVHSSISEKVKAVDTIEGKIQALKDTIPVAVKAEFANGYDSDIVQPIIDDQIALFQLILESRLNRTADSTVTEEETIYDTFVMGSLLNSDVTEIKQGDTIGEYFLEAVNNLLNNFKTAIGPKVVNGITYIKLENLLMYCNSITEDSRLASLMYDTLKTYLDNNLNYVLIDKNNNKFTTLEHISRQESSLPVEVTTDNSTLRLDINSFVTGLTKEENKEFNEALDALRKGDELVYKITTVSDKGTKYQVIEFRTKNGNKLVSRCPIPTIDPKTGSFSVINDGWITDVNSSTVASSIGELFKQIIIGENGFEELSDIVYSYAFDTLKDKDKELARKQALVKVFEEWYKSNGSSIAAFIDKPDSGIDFFTLLNGLSKLCKYIEYNTEYAENTEAHKEKIKNTIDNYLNKLNTSYNTMLSLSQNPNNNIVVTTITDGYLIRTDKTDTRPINEALANPEETKKGCKVCAVVPTNSSLVVGTASEPIDSANRYGFQPGNTFVVIPSRNETPVFVHAFSTLVFDGRKFYGNDLISLINRIESDIEGLIDTNDYIMLANYLSQVFGFANKKMPDKIIPSLFRHDKHKSLTLRYSSNGEQYTKFCNILFTNTGKFHIVDDSNKIVEENVSKEKALSTIKDIINSLQIGISFSYLQTDGIGTTNFKGIANKTETKEGSKFVITLPRANDLLGEEFTLVYDSYNDFLIQNNALTLSTKPNEQGTSNFEKRNEDNQTTNQVLYVKVESEDVNSPMQQTLNVVESIGEFNTKHVTFDEASHTYYVDGEKVDTSVTSWLTKDKPKEEEEDKTVAGFLEVASPIGNVHDELGRTFFIDASKRKEQYPNMTSDDVTSFDNELKKLKEDLDKEFPNGYKVITDEKYLRLVGTIEEDGKQITVAGTMDMLIVDNEGNLHVYDFKTHRANKYLDFHDDSYQQYSKQVKIYVKLLEANYPELRGKVKEGKLIQFNVKYETPMGSRKYETGTTLYRVKEGQVYVELSDGSIIPIQEHTAGGERTYSSGKYAGLVDINHNAETPTVLAINSTNVNKEDMPNDTSSEYDSLVTSINTLLSADSKANNIGYELAKLIFTKDYLDKFGLPTFRSQIWKEILPKTIIFDEDYNSSEENKHKNATANVTTGVVTIGTKLRDMLISSNPEERYQAVRKLIHEQIHIALHKPGNRVQLSKLREVFEQFKKHLDDTGVAADAHIRAYAFAGYEQAGKEDVALEEFIVESLTSKELADYLNNIEIGETNKPHKAKNLLERIFELVSKMFGLELNTNSLYAKEIKLLADAKDEVKKVEAKETLKTKEDNIGSSGIKIEAKKEIKNDFSVDDNFLDDLDSTITEESYTSEMQSSTKDDNIYHSSITEYVPTIPSVEIQQEQLPLDLQSKYADRIDTGEIEISCRI